MEERTVQFGTAQSCRGRILLLGDDGRMIDLLQRRFQEYQIQIEANVLDGVLRLGRQHYDCILLNAELLESKTAQAVKALRQMTPDATVLLYGDAYSEMFARRALRSGADDYLIWPVPAEELRDYLEHPFSRAATTEKTDKFRLLEQYHRLSQWAGQDKAELIRQAEKIVASVLGAEWVRIHEIPAGAAESLEDMRPTGGVPLIGPAGIAGRMEIAPLEQGRQRVNRALAREVGMFIGSLIHLAQRCEGLRHLATVDELTGAYNRRYLECYLSQLIEQSNDDPSDIALLLFDIDDFKHYNDTYGHVAGDELLKQVTVLTQRCCRKQDVVARVGGDEFAVLFWDAELGREAYQHDLETHAGDFSSRSESHSETAFFLSNRFRRVMRTSEFPALGPEVRGVLTISGGLACFGHDGQTAEQLFAKADEALLAAKRSGKNRIYLVGHPDS